MLAHPFPDAFALDIGDLSLKLVQLRNHSLRHRKPQYDIVLTRETKLPPGLIINGEIQEPEKVRKYLLHMLSGANGRHKPVRGRWVTACIPDTQGFIKVIQIHKKTEDIIAEDVEAAAKKHIPFEVNKYYLDWQVIPPRDTVPNTETNVIIAAAPKIVVDMYTYLLESVGLGVIALEIEALATSRAMVTADKEYQGEARAILDIGAARSTLIIHDHDHIQFSSSLPFSGEVFTMGIAQKLGIQTIEAEEIKKHDGLLNKKSDSYPIVESLAADLAKHIAKSVQFYYSHFSTTNNITHITMCGGGAKLAGLDKYLSTTLKIDAQPGRVWKNLFTKKVRAELSSPDNLHYATAIGLALRAADNPYFLHDLL